MQLCKLGKHQKRHGYATANESYQTLYYIIKLVIIF